MGRVFAWQRIEEITVVTTRESSSAVIYRTVLSGEYEPNSGQISPPEVLLHGSKAVKVL